MRKPVYILGSVLLAMVGAYVLVAGGVLSGAKADRPVIETEFLMGTVVTLKAYGPEARAAVDEAFARLHEIEDEMSSNLETSQVSRINASAGGQAVRVTEDVFYVIQKAVEYARLTRGGFDPTVGPLVKLWGIGTKRARVPERQEIEAARQLVGYQDIELDQEALTVKLKRPGMALELGGIVKGYAADEAARIFSQHDIKSAFVDLGGNVLVVGARPDGNPWRVAIQDPRGGRGLYVGVIPARDMSLVTSGDYERYFEQGGKRYHHILSPATGRPAESDLMSVTILSPSSIDADALSTGLFVLGREEALRLLEELPGVEGLLITRDRRIWISSGLKDRISDLNRSYRVVKGA